MDFNVVPDIAWIVAVIIIATIFITLVKSEQTARKALMWSLILGKLTTTVYMLVGLGLHHTVNKLRKTRHKT
ncbi:MAG: hypothetical protein QXM43_09705 [Desulfurococcaceae archaeon]